MSNEIYYHLKPGVQVRKEEFGLLFYDYRGPKLYFVPSQGMIDPDLFSGSISLGKLIEKIRKQESWPEQWISDSLSSLLEKLVERDLVYEQQVC